MKKKSNLKMMKMKRKKKKRRKMTSKWIRISRELRLSLKN